MRSISLALVGAALFSAAALAQQPQILRAADGSPATLPPRTVMMAPAPMPAPPPPGIVPPMPAPAAMPAPAVMPMAAPVAPTMTVRTVADLTALCAKQDTADEINSCLNLLSTAVTNVRATEAQRGSRYVCNSERLVNIKLRQTFLAWSKANPGFAQDDANRGVLTALMQAYPCPTGNVIGTALPASTVPDMNLPANPMTGY